MLADGQVREERTLLGNDTHQLLHLERLQERVHVLDLDGSRGRVQLRCYLPHQRGFSGAVGPKDRKNLTLKNVQIDSPIRDGAIWVTFNETANGNRRFLCRSFIKAPVPRRSMRIQIVSGVFTGYWYSLILFSMVPPSSCICRLMG